jgi:putative hydrolase of the HAD superfamily
VTDARSQQRRGFAHIDTWVFDLDNTLYPHHVNLWQQVDARIGEYIGQFLDVDPIEARRIQKDYYKRFGTSMRGMMTEHGVSADDYLAYVHQIDHSPLEANPAMGSALERLPGRKLILTNGSTAHAGKVLERLGFGHHFEAVFDIIAAELEPKPSPQTYRRFLERRRCRKGGDVRGSGAQPRRPASTRHDHRAGRAGRHPGGRARGLGDGRARRGARRPRHRRSGRVSGRVDSPLGLTGPSP